MALPFQSSPSATASLPLGIWNREISRSESFLRGGGSLGGSASTLLPARLPEDLQGPHVVAFNLSISSWRHAGRTGGEPVPPPPTLLAESLRGPRGHSAHAWLRPGEATPHTQAASWGWSLGLRQATPAQCHGRHPQRALAQAEAAGGARASMGPSQSDQREDPGGQSAVNKGTMEILENKPPRA